MFNPQETLFQLLRNEFFQEPLHVDALCHQDFISLMKLASRQTVEGLVAEVLMREQVKLDRDDAIYLFSRARMIESLNVQVTQGLLRLQDLLNTQDIRCLIFKGQTLAQLYPHPFARTPGDIDFYCEGKGFQNAVKLIEDNWHLKINSGESEKHHEFVYQEVHYELHFNILKFNNNKIQRYWDHLLDTEKNDIITIEQTAVRVLNPTLNTLYTFLHLYDHLVELGVGLRQFCDLMVIIHRFHHEIDREALHRHLTEMGFKRAFCAVGRILVDYLGLPKDELPVELPPKDRKIESGILDILWRGGNFGKYWSKTVVRSGLRYDLEATIRKFRHYYLFWNLSSAEIQSTIVKEIPKKIYIRLFHRGG